MAHQRISASSYSNTAPLIWSFLYGSMRGKYEVILDTAPARSAQLLAQTRVDAALVPVISYQLIEDVCLIPDVCVGAREKVQSVCLVTKGKDLKDVKSVSLDISSKTSVALTKIIFREFLGFEPEWKPAEPDLDKMLAGSDCALLIGDPALLVNYELRITNYELRKKKDGEIGRRGDGERKELKEQITNYQLPTTNYRPPTTDHRLLTYDLVELWREFTGFGFVFAMWMSGKKKCEIDFAKARDEGLAHIDEIISNYEDEISLSHQEFKKYLTENISFSIDDSMQKGLELYFQLAEKNGLIEKSKTLEFVKVL